MPDRRALLLAVLLACRATGDGTPGSSSAGSNPSSAFAALLEEDGAGRHAAGGSTIAV